MNRTSSRRRRVRLILTSLFALMVCLQLSSINSMAQATNTKSFLANRAALKTSTLKVAFMYAPGFPTEGQAVQFLDSSTGNPTSWQWNFGDGSTSTARNPVHVFSNHGFQRVTLTAVNGAGTKRVTRTIAVMSTTATESAALSSLSASFTYSPSSPTAGQTAQFTDTSSGAPTSWQWNFGDGTSSTAHNPGHSYSAAGSYDVSLTIVKGSESKSLSRTVNVAPAVVLDASFAYNPTSPVDGQAVLFTDTSTGNPTSWLWNFSDGTTSTSQSPSHTFAGAGAYNISLTVTGGSGSDSMSQAVNVLPAPVLAANFTNSPSSPVLGEAVNFSDASIGNPTSWQWDFGDGSTSTVQNPSYTYAAAGAQSITLTVRAGSDSSSISKTISVGYADVITAASASYADVSAAVSIAHTGDTVIVPAGSANWGTNYISTTKALSIIGAGIGQTNISAAGTYVFQFLPDATAIASDGKVRVSGFTINGNYRGPICPVYIEHHSSSIMHNFIVDHINFYHTVEGITVAGNIYGVGYQCHFEYTDPSAGIRDCMIFLRAIGNNEESWDDHHPDPANPYGHSDNFFIEDCSFEGNVWCEAGHGGRYVIRHNTFNNFNIVQAFDVHGNQPGLLYATIISEIYDNNFTNAQRSFEMFTFRGGRNLCYNNVITGVPAASNSWNKCYDDYDDSLAEWLVAEPAHEIMTPMDHYSWGNRANGTMFYMWLPPQTAPGGYPDPGDKLGENKTFWNEQLSFNGSVGVGVGPLSYRPATCATGVGYWATDTNTLYRATAPNTWSAYYTPFAYPHPLTNR